MSNSTRTIKRASMRRGSPPKCPKRIGETEPRVHAVSIQGRKWVCTCGWKGSANAK